MTARMTDAFSTVEIDVAAACAVDCMAAPDASAVVAIASETLLPVSPIASMTVAVASNTASIVSRAFPMPIATSSENTDARFCALPPTSETIPPTLRSWVAKLLYELVMLFRAFNACCSACIECVVASARFFFASDNLSSDFAYSSLSADSSPLFICPRRACSSARAALYSCCAVVRASCAVCHSCNAVVNSVLASPMSWIDLWSATKGFREAISFSIFEIAS